MRKITSKFLGLGLGLALMVGSVTTASAGTITWLPSVNLFAGGDNNNFISQNGTFVVGFNGGTTSATTTIGDSVFTAVNQATITGAGHTGGGVTLTSDFINDAGPTTFQDGEFTVGDVSGLINSGLWSGTSFTMSGLTVNQQYEMQILVNDARGGTGAGTRDTLWEVGFNDGVGGTTIAGKADLNNRPFNDSGDPNLAGDYIIGTFTAMTTTQTFDFAATRAGYTIGDDLTNVNAGQAQINAFQLRAIPEPSSLALLGLGSLFLAKRRRR